MTQTPYPDAPTPNQGPQDVPAYQGMPQAPPVPAAYGYGTQPMVAPQGMYYEPNTGLFLPEGVQLASVGRRIGAFFLSILLSVVTLGIGYIIWGLIAWSKGRGPTQQVLGMRCWRPADNRVAGWPAMALRNIVGYIAQSILGFITALVSFILFLSGKKHQSLLDLVGGTVVLYDPNNILDNWQG
jgi:RDD family